jgi:hypothetical protein
MIQLMRMGGLRPVPAKSSGSQEVRAMLGARKQLQYKAQNISELARALVKHSRKRDVQ